MNEKYRKFLEDCGIISEETFTEIVDSLPEFDIEDCSFNFANDNEDEIADVMINTILSDWSYVYCEEVNFADKTFRIEEVESLEDLNEIVKLFDKWTISNLEDMAFYLEDLEKDSKLSDSEQRDKLLNTISVSATLDNLKQIVEEYGF